MTVRHTDPSYRFRGVKTSFSRRICIFLQMNINEFITPSLLKSIHSEDLKRILVPIQKELIKFGLWFDEKKQSFPYIKLADYLRKCYLKREIEDALFFIYSLAELDSEDLLIALMNEGLDINGDTYKQSALLWFTNPKLAKEIVANAEVKKSRKYRCYVPTSPIGKISTLTDATLENLRTDLSQWFDKQQKSSYLVLLQSEDDKSVFISVFHGSNKKRQNTVDSDGSNVISVRYEISDILKIDKATGTIGICLRYKSPLFEKHYINVFGNAFVPNVKYLPETRYSLYPLYNLENAESKGSLANEIASFKITEIIAYFADSRLPIKLGALKEMCNFIPIEKFDFKSAKFSIVFRDSSVKHEIVITPPYEIELPERSGHDAEIEKLLSEIGYIVKNKVQKEDVESSVELGIGA